MKGIVVLLFVFTCQSLHAQRDSVYYFDGFFRKQKDPMYISYKGVLRKYNGKNHEVDFYTLDGAKTAFGEYSSKRLRKRNGVFVRYNGEERIILSANYRNGLLHGMLLRFHDNGMLADSGTLRFGINIGLWKSWYSTGTLKEMKTYSISRSRWGGLYSVLKNEYVSWYPNGQIQDSGTYRREDKHGIWLEWIEDGTVRSIGEYRRGWKRGLWRYFDTKGKLLYMRKFRRFNYDNKGTLVEIKH